MSAAVTLLTCDNIFGSGGKQFNYETGLQGSQLVAEVCKNLQMAEARNLRLLLRTNKETCVWISPTEILAHYNPANGMILYILRTNITIDLLTPDGSTKKILIDITKTVKELVQYISDKLRISTANIPTATSMNNSIGYSLYQIDKTGSHIPLDLNLTLPQQCDNYEKLFFKRRYFVFTKAQLRNQASAALIFNDVSANMNGKWTLTDVTLEQQADLLYFQLYSTINTSPEEVKPTSIPPNVTPNVRNLVTSYFETRTYPQTKEEAISQYLAIASQINGFGCERYNIKWATNNNTNQVQNGILSAGPQKVDILNPANNSIITSFPYTKYVSSLINQNNVNFRIISEESKTEYVLNLWCETPLAASSVQTLIAGYSTLYHDYSSDLTVNGFSKEDQTSEAEIIKGINISTFSNIYSFNQQTNKYIYYPGTVHQYTRIFEPVLSKIQTINPTISNDIAKNLQIVKNDPVNQEAILGLIFDIEYLSASDPTTATITGTTPVQGFKEIVDQKSIEYGILTLSTANITISGLEQLLLDCSSLLACQKIIRNEILLRVDVTWKNQIDGIAKALTTYESFLKDSINSMKLNPVDGTLLYQIQCKLIEIDLYLNNLLQFIETFSKFSAGTPYYATIDKFKKNLREVLRPLIPRETKDRLVHIVKLYELMLSLSITLAIGNEFKQDQSVVNNSDLNQKLNESLTNFISSYSKVQESKKKLTVRPLAIKYITIVKNDLFEVRRDLINCKNVAEMIQSISNNSTFNQSVLYSITALDSCIHLIDDLRTEPYRDVPTQQQLKQLHDLIVETLQKFVITQSNLRDQRSKDLYNNINDAITVLKTFVQILKQAIASPNKSIFGMIVKARTSVNSILPLVRELSSLLSDPGLYHYFSKVVSSFDDIMAVKTPTFGNLQMTLKEMISSVQSEMNEMMNSQSMADCLKVVTSANYPDREVQTLQMMKSILAPQLNDSSNPDKSVRLKKSFDSIQSVINCINQLPILNVYQMPRVNLVPFYKGKETNAMIQEFLPQVDLLSKVFKSIKSIPFFGSQKKFSIVIDYWERYFADCTMRIPQMKDDYICILAKLREVLKKKNQIAILGTNISTYISDFDSFNQQINTFFGNVDILIQALSKPCVRQDGIQSFVDFIQPKIMILQQLFINIESTSNKQNLNEKLVQLQQLLAASSGLAQLNLTQIQQFTDLLYQLLRDIVTIDNDKTTARSMSVTFTAASINLMNALSCYTELSLKDGNKVYPSIVPSKVIQQLCNDIIGSISVNLNNGIQPQNMTQLESTFNRYTIDLCSLPPSLAAASLFIKSQTVKLYPFDALRVLICSQTDRKLQLEQLRNMTIMFSMVAAQLVTSIIPFVEEIKTKAPSQKALFYATYLLRGIEGFDPKVLLESRNFQSVAFTYASLRDIRATLALLLTESSSLNPSINQYATNFLLAIDQADTSLALYFAYSVRDLLNELLSLYVSTNNDEKKELVESLIDCVNDPSLQIGPNYTHLPKLAKALPIIEKDINTDTFPNNDPFIADVLNYFGQTKEFKLISHHWVNPMSDSDSTSFWLNSYSDLTLSQASLSIIKPLYQKDILKVPLLFVRPSSLLTSLQVLCESCHDEQAKTLASVNKVSNLTNEILNQYGPLGSGTSNYQGDLRLQELLPQFFASFDSLVKEVMTLKEPNYQNLPNSDKLLGVTTAKQLSMILAQCEHTPLYDDAKIIIDYLKSQNQAQSSSPAVANTIVSTLNLLPTFIELPIKEATQELSDSLTKVFNNLAAQGTAMETLLAGFPNLLASMIKYLSTLNDKARKILNINVIYFIEALQKLQTATGNDPVIQRALIQNQLVQLSYFMTLKNQVLKDEDIEKNSATETLNLITFISNNDRNKIAITLMNLRSYQALAANRNLTVDLLNEIDEVLIVLNQNQQTNSLTPQQLGEQRDKLLIFLSNDTIKLAKLISSKNDVDSLINLRSEMKLVAQFTSSDGTQTAPPTSIRSLISIASNVELLSHRGLELTPNLSSGFVFEYIDTYFMSIQALTKFIEKQSKSDLRMFRRFVDNNGDLIDDLSLDGSSFEEQLGFSGLKSQFVSACANVLASVSTLNVGFSNASLMNTFNIILSREVPKITERANYLINSAKTMIETNTLKELNNSFIEATNVFHQQISSIVTNLQSANENTLVKIELPLIESIHSLASIANSMNDVVPIHYEPEQANKLPREFVLPTVDSTNSNLKPQDLAKNTLSLLKMVNLTEYTNYMAAMPANSPLVDTTLQLYEQLKTVLSSCLLVSHRSVNLQNKLDIIDNSNSLVASINNLNKGIRNKCLGSPTWLRDSQRALKDISEKLNAFTPLCQNAIDSADNEEKTLGELHTKIFSVLNPLQERIVDIENIADIISKNSPVTPEREFAITLCGLIGKGSSILSNLLLYAKDHPKEITDLDDCVARASHMINIINQLSEHFGYNRNNKDNSNLKIPSLDVLSKINQEVSGMLSAITRHLSMASSDDPEAVKMREQLKIISKGIETLGVTMTQSTDTGVQGQSKFNSPEAQQRLMTRLELESSVIKYRYRLDFLENQITKFG